MERSLYWDGEVDAADDYRKAYELRCEQDNYLAWLNGLYVRSAIVSSFGFGKSRPPEYPQKPIGSDDTENAKEKAKKKSAEDKKRERDDALFTAFMSDWMTSVNAKYKKKNPPK